MEKFQYLWFKNDDLKSVKDILLQIGKCEFENIIKDNPPIAVQRSSQMYLEYYSGHFYLVRKYDFMDLIILNIDHLEIPTEGWKLDLELKKRNHEYLKD